MAANTDPSLLVKSNEEKHLEEDIEKEDIEISSFS